MNDAAKKVVDHKTLNDTGAHINKVFNQQREYALELRESSVDDRKALLKKFLAVFEKYEPEIFEASYKDFNKPEAEALLGEIFPVKHEIKHTIRHLSAWAKPKKVSATMATFGTSSKVMYEPKGVCLIISPWNYPVNLTFGPLVSAIAAGNTAMIKPSEFTPHLAAVITKIVKECFDERHVAVFEGEVDVALALLEKPFDHIFFTGSPNVGKSIMAAAAKNLTSVTLELGGKSPVIVDETAKIKEAAGKVIWGKCSNNGQTCIAPDYLLVQESVSGELIQALTQSIKDAYGDDIKGNEDYARIVNQSHTQRIKALMDDGIAKGGHVSVGGEVDIEERFITPTIITGSSNDHQFLESRLMQEEIFGPVLPVITYTDIGDAIHLVNNLPKPLALYMYSEDKSKVENVLKRTTAGGSCVNTNLVQFLHSNLPFGGVNNSGIGNAHGEYGFKAFSHERAVLEDKHSVNHMLYPPYTKKVKTLTRMITKYFS